jgi:hypothetical protein
MKNFLRVLPLVGTLLVGGCGVISNPFTGAPITAADVQAAAVAACGFLPTAATVANIIAAGNPAVATVSTIAQAICSAVTAKGGRLGGAAPNVNGVPVHGRFVQ